MARELEEGHFGEAQRCVIHNSGGLRNVDMALGSILDSLPLGVAVYDTDLHTVIANAKALAILEHSGQSDSVCTFGADGPSATQWAEHLTSVLVTGQPVRLDRVPLDEDHGTRFLQVLLTPVKEGTGQQACGVVAVFQDVTDTLHLARELELTERSAALGKLTATVAHELTGPLDGVLRYVSLALRQLEQQDVEKAQEYLRRCQEGLQRMVQIAGGLLEYFRGMPVPVATHPLDQLVQDAVTTTEARWTGPAIEIRQFYGPNVPVLRRGNLFQVFCNIIRNAHEAMPDGGRLEIQAAVTQDNVLVMTFRDTGPGFAPQALDWVFEPFYTTKERGTGLGLAVCRDIIRQYKGEIEARNAAEGGAMITLHLPLAEIV